jgi:peroxiredoxin Q/BCP
MTLSIGERAPDFTLPSSSGQPVALSSLLAKGPVVLFFYPKDDTPGCTAEACSFRDSYDQFAAAGATVVGISSDSEESHERFATKHKLQMTLLSDRGGKVRALYGIKPKLGFIPGRQTIVIDRDGTVRYVFDSQIRMEAHSREALAVVQALSRATAARAS